MLTIESKCIPCLVRQAHDLIEHSLRVLEKENDEDGLPLPDPLHLMTEAIELIAHLPLEQYTAPEVAAEIQHHLRELTGVDDPYRDVKHHMNESMLQLLPRLREGVERSDDPLRMATLLAARGNLIDLAPGTYDPEKVAADLLAQEDHVCVDDMDVLRTALKHAEKILYLHDNAGEIVTDVLLLERLPREKVISVVRGKPVINDATMEDAEMAGVTQLVETITTGAAIPGISIPESSLRFVKEFVTADLIIAKGQGNFETLMGMREIPILFVFKAKCDVIAARTGCPKGSTLIMANDHLKGKIKEWEGK